MKLKNVFDHIMLEEKDRGTNETKLEVNEILIFSNGILHESVTFKVSSVSKRRKIKVGTRIKHKAP